MAKRKTMTERISYEDLAGLLKHLPNMEFGAKPIFEEPGKWAVFEVTLSYVAKKMRSLLAYVYSDANRSDLTHLQSTLSRERADVFEINILTSVSYFQKNKHALVRLFESVPAAVSTSADYLVTFFRKQLERYIGEMTRASGAYYVEPHIVAMDGKPDKNPGKELRRFLSAKNGESSRIGVLLAEPGQGKTFLAGQLASELAKANRVPLYVTAGQWNQMQRDQGESIWKAMAQSFRAFNAPIHWIEGIEEEFISICLKAGLFIVIFDGFDEFILRNAGRVDALETLTSLQRLAETSGAKILVTARTSFWNGDVAPRIPESLLHSLFAIEPFDQRRANTYFAKRFPAARDKRRKQAERLFGVLTRATTKKGVNFVGRGFFLYHIADLVERGFGEDDPEMGQLTATQWISRKLCDREIERQQISLTVDQQLQVLSELAYFLVLGSSTDSDTMSTIISAALESSASSKLVAGLVGSFPKVRGALMDHPIIEFNESELSWRFRQEQLAHVFVAERLFDIASAVAAGSNAYHGALPQQLNYLIKGITGPLRAEIASTLVEHVMEFNETPAVESKLKGVIAAIVDSIATMSEYRDGLSVSYLATAIAMEAVSRLLPPGKDRRDRTQMFVDFLPSASPTALHFEGTVSGFDLSDIAFARCSFKHVTWVGCKFSPSTIFDRCKFEGGAVVSCEGFGTTTCNEDCELDADSRALFDSEQRRAGRRQYDVGRLRDDLQTVLRKFLVQGSGSLRTVDESLLGGGKIAGSEHKDEIIWAFKRFIIQPKGQPTRGHAKYEIRGEAANAVFHFAQNGVFSGAIAMTFDYLKHRLKIA